MRRCIVAPAARAVRPSPIVIAGGGFVGFYTALQLERRLRPGEAHVTLISPENFMLYQPLLAEVASGTLGPGDVIVPLRVPLSRTRFVTGRLVGIDVAGHTAAVRTTDGENQEFGWDHLVLGLGAEARVFPVPGLVDEAVGFGSLGEATALRNELFERLETAEASRDPATRRRALTFVVVGGGYTGVEAIAELEDLARYASRWYRRAARSQQRWVLVEASDRILPVVDRTLSEFAAETLRRRGIEVRVNTRLTSATGGTCPPNAQYAERQARHLAGNLAAVVRGGRPSPFRYRSRGEFVTLGRYKAVGEVFGRRLRGFPPWFLRRTYYVSRIPTTERKVRLIAGWTLALLFPRDPINLTAASRGGEALRRAADPS